MTLNQMIEEIVEVQDDLCTAWEWEFISDMSDKAERKETFSDKQEEVIRRIYRKACRSEY